MFLRCALLAGLIVAVTHPILGDAPSNRSQTVEDHRMPYRVHVFEDYETKIEERWWLRGKPSTDNPPPSLSRSLPNTRYGTASETKNFDRKMEDQEKLWKAVIFNPVPGPPMAGNTRLRFRYKLSGTDQLRVQIYSLSKGYHRYLLLTDLPQGQWQLATVDMTQARRPDGSGGPLAADERIDDIQFYIPPTADLAVDDIVLYEPGKENEKRKFPRRTIFTGWFDTGKQGNEWPGIFEIVLHEKPRTWDAAKSLTDPDTGMSTLAVNMRGERQLSERTELFFRYRLKGADAFSVVLTSTNGEAKWRRAVPDPAVGRWSEATVKFEVPKGATADTISFGLPRYAELWIDDLLLYEPDGRD